VDAEDLPYLAQLSIWRLLRLEPETSRFDNMFKNHLNQKFQLKVEGPEIGLYSNTQS